MVRIVIDTFHQSNTILISGIKRNFSEGGIYDPTTKTIIAHWLLPVTGLARKAQNFDDTKISVGDLVCSESFLVNIEGPLKEVNATHWIVDRHLQTFEINFDFAMEEVEIGKENGMGTCMDVLYIKAENSSCFYPRIQYCLAKKQLKFTHFNGVQCDAESVETIDLPIVKIEKLVGKSEQYHLQYSQSQSIDSQIQFLIYIDDKLVATKPTNNFDTNPKEVYFSNLSASGFNVSNLIITEK